MGVLRRQLWLDRLAEFYANRKISGMDVDVRLALRLGLYQLRFLSRIPASAAVNESVNLVYFARLRSAGGMVNAVLRRATREPDVDPTLHDYRSHREDCRFHFTSGLANRALDRSIRS